MGTSRLDVKGGIQVINITRIESTNARHWDGIARMSEEVAVMAMEQRSYVR